MFVCSSHPLDTDSYDPGSSGMLMILESARATLTRWVALDPLAEEAYRRLMRVALAQGDATAALQVYTTLQARLAEALQITPSPETVALAEHSRALAARRRSSAVPRLPWRATHHPS